MIIMNPGMSIFGGATKTKPADLGASTDGEHGTSDGEELVNDMRSTVEGREVDQMELLQRIESNLRQCAYPELQHITAQLDENSIHLIGRVTSYFMKQMAQETVRRAVPKLRVKNHLEVCANLGVQIKPR